MIEHFENGHLFCQRLPVPEQKHFERNRKAFRTKSCGICCGNRRESSAEPRSVQTLCLTKGGISQSSDGNVADRNKTLADTKHLQTQGDTVSHNFFFQIWTFVSCVNK